ncbi:hypothetical protein PR202_gb24028 [Eleusine coracana subsp. coracana]|uniref:Uncharacterized protein n=1 Tax=Eleusine coracana subsp. coracana TaxID=191504 RepID=A0AAV5FJT6_ELECO|nr:hypothetical protein PR202_gb24028 [Eleusine coracana subsp. coracana]
MASAARRARSAARRPFAVLASPSPARNGGAIASAENVAAPEAVPFALRVRRFGKVATKKCGGGGAGLLSPISVSKKPASRRRMCPLSTTMASATPAPELSSAEEVTAKAVLSSISDEASQARRRERPRVGERRRRGRG